jgi:hypothetical protein
MRKNERGEILVIGIDELNKVINSLNNVEVMLDNKFYTVTSADEKGLRSDSSLIANWRELDDRHTEKDGIMFGYDNWNTDKYFYFKLTDEEREKNPYNFWAEKKADLEDKFRDNEDLDMIPYLKESKEKSILRKLIRESLK